MVGFGVFIGWVALASANGPSGLQRFTYTEYLMGVDTRIVVYAPSEKSAQDACAAAFERIAALDAKMSDYRPDSELMRLSDRAGGPPVHVSQELFTVLQKAEQISRESGGLFDVTVGPVVHLWRDARKSGKLPDPIAIARARDLVDWRKMRLDPDHETVRLDIAGMRLDLGAIGKGYADDEAQKVLRRHGITRALVEMGGDIVVSDPPPGTKGWRIEVPNAGHAETAPDMLFSNCAVSSSGDTEEYVIIGGERFSHVVNPHTGRALTSRVQSTVIGKDGLDADPLSTAATLLDQGGCDRLAKLHPGTHIYVRVLPEG